MKEHTIELLEGYTDKNGKKHKTVTFGKRLTLGDMMMIDRDPQGQNPVLYEDLIRRLMITKFGTLNMPVMLPVLLKLDTIERDDLALAGNEFIRMTQPDDKGEFLPDNSVRLMFGLTIESVTYDVIKFGNRLTGQDQAEAYSKNLIGLSKLVYEIGKQVCEISDSESGLSVKGSLTIEQMSQLDSEDFALLRVAGELYRQSFRFGREILSGKQNGKDGSSSDDQNKHVRKRNTKPSGRKI